MSDNTITVKEFKMWLDGVEEMQPEGWTPDQRQWTRIREKINSIGESTSVQRNPAPQPEIRYEQAPLVYQTGSGLRPAPAPAPVNPLFGNADSPSIPVKTPNTDTSTSPYEPPFV